MPKKRRRFTEDDIQPAKLILWRRGIPQQEAAVYAGVSSSSMSEVLNGLVEPTPAVAEKLSELLGVSADELFKPVKYACQFCRALRTTA